MIEWSYTAKQFSNEIGQGLVSPPSLVKAKQPNSLNNRRRVNFEFGDYLG